MPCQEPAQEISSMTRSCGRDLISKASGLERPPGPAWASSPKPESVCLTILCLSPTLLTLTGGYPWPPFSGENQLRALANKSPGHERNISNQNPCSILPCLACLSRLLQLCMWLLNSLPTVRSTGNLKQSKTIEPFKELKAIRIVLV